MDKLSTENYNKYGQIVEILKKDSKAPQFLHPVNTGKYLYY